MFTFLYRQVTINLFKTGLLVDAYFKKITYIITKPLFYGISLRFIEKYITLHIFNQGKKIFYGWVLIWDTLRRYTTYQLVGLSFVVALVILVLVI